MSERDGVPVQGATLTGGLQLDAWAWLVDYPPHVHCDLPEPAPVTIDDVDHGYMEPGEPLTLGVLAGDSGTHRVEVAGLYELEFELRESGSRDGIGTVGRYPKIQGCCAPVRSLRRTPANPPVHGSSGRALPGARTALAAPGDDDDFNSTVHVIYRDGR